MSALSDRKNVPGEITAAEAGRKGGQTTLAKYGHSWYAHLGSLGSRQQRCLYPNKARDWGRMGGRPKVRSLNEIEGEPSQSKKK